MILRTVLTLLPMGVLLAPALVAAAPVSLDNFGTSCIETILDDCKVLSAGYLNGDLSDEIGNPMLAWQTQAGSTEEAGLGGGVVLLQAEDDGWVVLEAAFDGQRYSPPTLNGDGVLHVAGYTSGSGAFNADLLYQTTDLGQSWQKIDMDSGWFSDIEAMLPAGLGIWKGVAYDFSNGWTGYTARSSLWREDDANCCATGGSAVITLEIVDNALKATGVDYTPPEKTKAGS